MGNLSDRHQEGHLGTKILQQMPLAHTHTHEGHSKSCSLTWLITRYVHHILSLSTYSLETEMHLVQHFSKAWMLLMKKC